jgi:hypothetical protein
MNYPNPAIPEITLQSTTIHNQHPSLRARPCTQINSQFKIIFKYSTSQIDTSSNSFYTFKTVSELLSYGNTILKLKVG